MITIRGSQERGHFNHGWLKTYHTFSFAEYQDKAHLGYRALRVINEDTVAPAKGFGTHPHRDMEIITYVLEGQVEHKDSLGNSSVIRPGEVQRMSAGTGVKHSEFNPAPKEPLHLLQIWILPEKKNLKPGYEQKAFKLEEKLNRLKLVASQKPKGNAVEIHQDADVYVSVLEKGMKVEHAPKKGRGIWLQVVRGSVELNGHFLNQGDGASAEDETLLTVTGRQSAEILLFDLA